ncbi:ABC transporter permease [Curtobacterium ammoniigenes]|uniref:ABC transporter permease n=1 Tax=Curtobacterium ammoniigenes TaxID=395387 RepID=UPI000836461B|nr:ABC transporter permease subunit [Curtobacterium ammoniigenes]
MFEQSTARPIALGARASRRTAGRLPLRIRISPMTALWVVIIAILVLPIAVFLTLAIAPALLDQGTSWFSLSAFADALSGQTLVGFADSTAVGLVASVSATAVGTGLAWVVARTNATARRVATGLVFALFLTPSYLIALGWERLLEPNGVLQVLGADPAPLRSVIYGPVGVALVLAVKGVPFAYLSAGNALAGLGREYEDAVRVHGGRPGRAIVVALTLIAPAIWSSLAIVFAESVSDYGVAATLANAAHFPVATYTLYLAVQAFPVNFPLASAVSWLLLALIVLALALQRRALGRRGFEVLSARTRTGRRTRLSPGGQAVWLVALTALTLTSLGVPTVGAISASLIDGLGSITASHTWGFANYARVLHSPDLGGPLVFSTVIAAIVASIAVVLAVVCARVLAKQNQTAGGRVLDSVLLAAVALPGIVFAAGYIFTFNLPFMNTLGIKLYGTTALLGLAYLATALPSTTRLLVGAMAQLQRSMAESARAHGANGMRAWWGITVPMLARPILSAWLLTYAGTLLELPVSQLLAPAGTMPVAVGIQNALGRYDFGGGTAMEVMAILSALVVVAIGYGGYALFAPAGWKRIGATR